MTFRKDLNGLRAIAVLAVLFFHFKIIGFKSGFSGVDIFFVISGYLMTGIIFSKIENAKLSIIEFYLHRARRIIPALAILCIFLIIFGFFFFLTPEYRDTLRNIKSAIQFTSNYKLYNSFGYFDTPSQENWLLHTWSLSVEWQFYLIYPIIILFLRKCITIQLTKVALIGFTLLSLITSIIYTPINPSAAFYFLPTRAWEMLAGGIVFLFPLRQTLIQRTFIGYLGFGLIFISIFLLNNTLWPSYFAMLPVLGTMLIIWSEKNSFITNNFIFQWLGKISYSLYLWHWPIVVLLLTSDLLHKPIAIIIGIIIAILLASLSHFFIEQKAKLKYSNIIELTKYLTIIIAITITSAILASLVKNHPQIRTGGLFSKHFKEIEYLAETRHPYDKQCFLTKDKKILPECKIGSDPASIIVLGDSHANSIFSAVQIANDKGASILWAHMGCPILNNVKFTITHREGCIHLIKEKLALLTNSNNYSNIPVLIVNRLFNVLGNDKVSPQIYFTRPKPHPDSQLFQEFRASYLQTVCSIAEKHPVYILKPIPEANFDVPKKLIRELIFSIPFSTKGTSLKTYYDENAFILNVMEEAHKQCGVTLLDPIPYLCPNGQCIISKEGKPLYFDDNHLTEYGNTFLIPLFKKIFLP